VDVGALREQMAGLGLGEVSLQTFGDANTVLVRVQQQAGGDAANAEAVEKIKVTLGEGWTYNRAEAVGPTVGSELLQTGIWATILAIFMVGVYVAFRFEWQFGVSALVCTLHDVFVSLCLVAIMGWEFNLTTVAALLTLAGYSINDTVIVFDRIREMLRRYKTLPMDQIINLSVNHTLSRTLLTSITVLLAILPMMFLGGETLMTFTGVIVWGVFIGTFSSIYVAAALLLYMPPLRMGKPDAALEQKPEVA
jgi:preprotein translocase subunit SecF